MYREHILNLSATLNAQSTYTIVESTIETFIEHTYEGLLEYFDLPNKKLQNFTRKDDLSVFTVESMLCIREKEKWPWKLTLNIAE